VRPAAPPLRPPAAAARPGSEPAQAGVAAPAARCTQLAEAVRIVGWLSLAAGVIHAVAAIDHFDHYWLYGVFFLALTYGQVLWGIALLRGRVDDRGMTIGALANLAIVAVWLYSRTIGVPIGPEAGRPEAVGVMDVAATLDQLVLAAYVAAIVRPQLRDVRAFRALIGRHRVRFAMALGTASVFATLFGHHHH
jgi:hypothetical protein